MPKPNTPQYGSWVSPRLIAMSAILTIIFGDACVVLSLSAPNLPALILLLTLPAVFFAVCAVYFLYAKRLFSPGGRDIQNKVLDLLIGHIHWDGEGKALDIGCGSGALAVKLAKRYPHASIAGLDSWGAKWGYAQAQCEHNAALEGVDSRTIFVHGSADALPFADDTFDLVVSNMTFHEVKARKSKTGLLTEALRVLKPGGRFVLQDLFLLKRCFGTPEELTAALKVAGAKEARFKATHTAPFIPKALKLPFMLGAMGVLWGEK